MIYLNDTFKNAGKIFNNRSNKRDYAIDEKIDISIIIKLFNDYKVIHKSYQGGAEKLKIQKTVINIYKHKDDIL